MLEFHSRFGNAVVAGMFEASSRIKTTIARVYSKTPSMSAFLKNAKGNAKKILESRVTHVALGVLAMAAIATMAARHFYQYDVPNTMYCPSCFNNIFQNGESLICETAGKAVLNFTWDFPRVGFIPNQGTFDMLAGHVNTFSDAAQSCINQILPKSKMACCVIRA